MMGIISGLLVFNIRGKKKKKKINIQLILIHESKEEAR